MDVIYGLIPTMIVIGLALIVILFWAIKSGQFDDLEGDAHRILMDEDLMPEEKNKTTSKDEKKANDKADELSNND